MGSGQPALVLRACDDPGLRYVIVWYTCSKQRSHCKNKEVTGDIPQERRRGKQTFLNHDPAMIRRVPRKQAWFGDRLAKIDRTVMDGHLKTAMQLPFLVFDSAGRVPCHAADGGN